MLVSVLGKREGRIQINQVCFLLSTGKHNSRGMVCEKL